MLGVPLFVAAEERMGTFEQACDASVWSVPEDEVKLCALFDSKYHVRGGHDTMMPGSIHASSSDADPCVESSEV